MPGQGYTLSRQRDVKTYSGQFGGIIARLIDELVHLAPCGVVVEQLEVQG